ncbi:MAG: 4-phospho-D-threonate 3-dehydrogenase, partial [Planctomycetaceae bacterium]|nr:4-phospho-D-threonate 3-dehydrogenase [Planctomycetaceae bacterium]
MNQPLPVFTISIGDPSGIGPEVAVKACADESLHALARWVIVGEAWQVAELAEQFGLTVDQVITDIDELANDSRVAVLDAQQISRADVTVAQVSAVCGEAAVNYVRIATQLCIDGKSNAIVTAPINKEAVVATGRKGFCGHTEFIADMCGRDTSRMLLVNDQLCVVHVTTHCSLFDAATKIDIERIRETIEIGHQAMLHLGFKSPRLCICGLNPH